MTQEQLNTLSELLADFKSEYTATSTMMTTGM